jgi:hypothetical protein
MESNKRSIAGIVIENLISTEENITNDLKDGVEEILFPEKANDANKNIQFNFRAIDFISIEGDF